MGLTGTTPSTDQELYHALGRALAYLELAATAALLLLALVAPATGRVGAPVWALLLLSGVYTLLLELLRHRLPWRRPFARKYLLGLPGVGLVYALGPGPGGLLFVLFFVAVACAVASLPLRRSVLYTAMSAALVAAIDLSFLSRPPTPADLREGGARLVLLAVFGASMAILTWRLARQHAATRLIRVEAERLAELDRVRTDFIATISHDLRTPLTAAHAALLLVATSAADRLHPDERSLLDNGRRNTERLDTLIADLLTLNQLEAGTLRRARAALDLGDVADAAVATVAPLLQAKGQPLAVEVPEPLPAEGEPRRLERAVVNLLTNAHRHTPAGTRIVVRGAIIGGEVRLTVRDDGAGIPRREHEAIFRHFHRLSPAGAADGHGLGLAIARGIVELHGGRLWVESEPGHGATFHVALPVYRDGEAG